MRHASRVSVAVLLAAVAAQAGPVAHQMASTPVQSRQPNGRHHADPPVPSADVVARDGRDLCDFAIDLPCDAVYSGSSAASQNGNAWEAYCYFGETAPEIIHRLEHPGGLLSLTLSSTDSNQLDLILLGSCDPADCLAMPWLVGSSESISGDFSAGTYYVVVDAYSWNSQPFTYQLGVECLGAIDPCEAALPLPCGATVQGSSAQSQNGNAWSSYCFSGDSGPEVIYALNHPGGFLSLQLSSSDSNQLDLILLGGCDPSDCLAMPWWVGSEETISGDYPAGTYYVVVDAYAWNGQPFTFTLGATCPGETDPCQFALPLACNQTVPGSSAASQNGNLWSGYCFTGESGPEVIYAYEHPGGLLSLALSSDDSNQLDLILLGSCDPSDCLAMPWWVGSAETISGIWPAGTYYVVIDAFLWNGQPFTFQLSTGPCLGTDAVCHHESTGLSLSLPDPLGVAQRYYQLFNGDTDATLSGVLLHIDAAAQPHDGTLTLGVWEMDGELLPTVLAGAVDVDAGALVGGWAEFDLSSLSYQIHEGVDYYIGLDFAPATPADRLGFFAGSPGGYEGFSTFYNGVTYDNWWSNGAVFFDELNLCVRLAPPCPPVALQISVSAGDAVLSWEPSPGLVRLEASSAGYGGTTLAVVDGMAGVYIDDDALALGRRFYQAVRVCE
jgi:hypothetical protein